MIKYKSNRGIAQLVARLSGGQEVVSSSLATPTKKSTKFFKALSILILVRLIFASEKNLDENLLTIVIKFSTYQK